MRNINTDHEPLINMEEIIADDDNPWKVGQWMYIDNYRIFDHYQHPVISLAFLIDQRKKRRSACSLWPIIITWSIGKPQRQPKK